MIVTTCRAAAPPVSNEQLVALLGSDVYATREWATSVLKGRDLGSAAMVCAGMNSADLEIKYRCRRIYAHVWNKNSQSIINCTTRVTINGLSGFGTIVKSDANNSYILTNYFPNYYSKDATIKVYHDGNEYDGDIVKKDADNNPYLILVSIEKGNLPVAKLAKRECVSGEKTCYVGYDDQMNPTVKVVFLGNPSRSDAYLDCDGADGAGMFVLQDGKFVLYSMIKFGENFSMIKEFID
jgi:S1-C subfamily serine protease